MFKNRVWDYTAISTFLSCRKEFYFFIVKGYRPKHVSVHLRFGLAVHDALDTLYTKGLDEALKVFEETYVDEGDHSIKTMANGLELMRWYAEVYKHEPFKVIGKPETGFVFPVGDIMWGGRMDLPVDWDGELWIMEHKTCSRLDSNYFKQFDLDMQVTSYILAAEEYLGKKCMGCIINALEPWKPLVRPRATSKKPEDHYARAPIHRTQRLKDIFKLNIQRHVRDIQWCADNDEWAESHKKDVCRRYNADCPYKKLCMYGEDPRFIEQDYIIEPWLPYQNLVEVSDDKGSDKSTKED